MCFLLMKRERADLHMLRFLRLMELARGFLSERSKLQVQPLKWRQLVIGVLFLLLGCYPLDGY